MNSSGSSTRCTCRRNFYSEVPYFRSVLLLPFLHIHNGTPIGHPKPLLPVEMGVPLRGAHPVTAVQCRRRQAVWLSSQVSTLGCWNRGVCGGSVRTTAGLHRDGGHCLTAAATSNCLLLLLPLLQCRGATRQEGTERFKAGFGQKIGFQRPPWPVPHLGQVQAGRGSVDLFEVRQGCLHRDTFPLVRGAWVPEVFKGVGEGELIFNVLGRRSWGGAGQQGAGRRGRMGASS